MARDTSLRETKTWRVVTLSTGEVPMEAKLSESGGRKPRAGEQVRMLDILADRGKGFGVFSSPGPKGTRASSPMHSSWPRKRTMAQLDQNSCAG